MRGLVNSRKSAARAHVRSAEGETESTLAFTFSLRGAAECRLRGSRGGPGQEDPLHSQCEVQTRCQRQTSHRNMQGRRNERAAGPDCCYAQYDLQRQGEKQKECGKQ